MWEDFHYNNYIDDISEFNINEHFSLEELTSCCKDEWLYKCGTCEHNPIKFQFDLFKLLHFNAGRLNNLSVKLLVDGQTWIPYCNKLYGPKLLDILNKKKASQKE